MSTEPRAHNWPTGCSLCGNQNCHNGACQRSNDKIPCRICGIPAERHYDALGHVWAEA